jgi:hypothetical protein
MTSEASSASAHRKGVSFTGVPPTVDRSVRLPPYPNEEYRAITIRMNSLFEACKEAFAQEKQSKKLMSSELSERFNAQIRGNLEQLDQLPDQEHLRVRVTKMALCCLGMRICCAWEFSETVFYATRICSIKETFLPIPEGAITYPWWHKSDEWKLFFERECISKPPRADRLAQLPPYSHEEYRAIPVRMKALFKECTEARAQEDRSGERIPMEFVKQINVQIRETLGQLDQLPDQEHERVRAAKIALCRLGMWFCIRRCVSAAGRYATQARLIQETFSPVSEGATSVPWWQSSDEWRLFFKREC